MNINIDGINLQGVNNCVIIGLYVHSVIIFSTLLNEPL